MTLYETYLTNEDLKKRIDQMFASIAPYLEKSAVKYELKVSKWYNNLPLWLAETAEVEPEVVRVIHIGPAEVEDTLHLSVAVDVYKDNIAAGKRHALRRAKVIGRVTEESLETEPSKFVELFDSAYGVARSVTERDLIKISPIPTT